LPRVCVVYLLREVDGVTEVLLGRKLTGLGLGRLVGPGGKLEPGETSVQAIIREAAEEVGVAIDAADLDERGSIDYHFPHREAWSQASTVFVCRRWSGAIVASGELAPEWFPIDAVPFGEMWDDARRWLPGVLAGGGVDARFTFGEDLATVIAEASTGPV